MLLEHVNVHDDGLTTPVRKLSLKTWLFDFLNIKNEILIEKYTHERNLK